MEAKYPLARCEICPLKNRDFVPPYIPPDSKTSDILVVGESPGRTEVVLGRPFVGQSGNLLRQAMRRVGIDPDGVLMTNSVLCLPTDAKTLDIPLARNACRDALFNVVRNGISAGRRYIALFGREAADAFGVNDQFVWMYSAELSAWMIALPHPAYILRRMSESPLFFQGIAKLARRSPYEPKMHLRTTWLDDPKKFPYDAIARAPYVVIDIETDTLDPSTARTIMVGIGVPINGRAFYAYIIPEERVVDMIPHIAWMVREHAAKLGGHNVKFDFVHLARYGVPIAFGWDTLPLAHAWNEHIPLGLKELSALFFDAVDWSKGVIVRGRWADVSQQEIGEYLSRDLYYTYLLHDHLRTMLGKQGRDGFVFDFLPRVAVGLARMEHHGVCIDMPKLKELIKQFEDEQAALCRQLQAITGVPSFNPNSPQQCANYLYGTLKMPKKQVAGLSENSTAAAILNQMDQENPFVRTLLRYRRVQKMLASYLRPLMELARPTPDGLYRVHPQWRQTGTVTGRLSAANPSIQNIPRADEQEEGFYGKLVRDLFIAPPGHVLVAVDGSQWELRVAACESGDPFLIGVYQRGGDVHGEVSRAMFGEGYTKTQRSHAKRFVFSWLYGGSEESSAQVFQVPRSVVKQYVARFNEALKRAVEWRSEQYERARTQGYLQSRAGRRFHFPLIFSGNSDEVRKGAINYPIQGAASDLTLQAFIDCFDALLEIGAFPVILVHDSIVVEVPEDRKEEAAKIVVNALVKAAERVYPEIPWSAEAEYGSSWGSMHELRLE